MLLGQWIPVGYELAVLNDPDDVSKLAITLVVELDITRDPAPGGVAEGVDELVHVVWIVKDGKFVPYWDPLTEKYF